ncbi:MAG: NHLP bacteriocin export ABC transporter permease/ATPase subunit [Lachnospiraceae bacterium]|nr:NHLP bacteriocin export ABC transporter permease/ATPase subunit [Lachnospiraceae bacterium]
MGWFDEQIKQRRQKDHEVFEESLIQIAGSVMGAKVSAALKSQREIARDAVGEILKYYHVKGREVPEEIQDRNERLEYVLRPYGIMRRSVRLANGWYKDAVGAMLGIRKSDGTIVALIPGRVSGYRFLDLESGKWVHVNRKNQELFEDEALAFYKPLPLKKLGIRDLWRYLWEMLSGADLAALVLATLGVTLVGMLAPKLNYLVFSNVVPAGSMRLLLAIAVCLVSAAVSTILLKAVQTLLQAKINTKMSIAVQAASMARVLSLPAKFFKNYSSGELSSRVQYMNTLCNQIVSAVLSTGLTSICSLVYITQIFAYAPALVVPAMLVIGATVLFSVVSALVQMRVSRRQMELASKESGMSYALISGVQKIKLAGAEKRAFARWGSLYAKQAKLIYNPPVFLKIITVISTGISLLGTWVMYFAAVRSQVPVADYYAFHTAYGMVSGAFFSLATIALTVAQIQPMLHMVRPVLEAAPEISEGKQVVTSLLGGIELNQISFRYREDMPLVVDQLSLKIRPGQYVALVGATGCGKSTLMRLMLGFETPQKGAVYYDGRDLTSMDLKSLRRRIGVVMQDGKLFSGDIFSNIIISAPWLTLDEAWEAAELAGIADDIRRMPMGMYTMISEGAGGVSGGQRQRLMIARAIAPKPKILMFDEATSALDNLTQKKVSESLAGLKCTRIVIAHRLSTIQQCDRILVLDRGRIVEDGTYGELMEKGGYFAELVERQKVE